MRLFRTHESIGIHLTSRTALAVVWGLPKRADYSDFDTRVVHIRIFGLVFGLATDLS